MLCHVSNKHAWQLGAISICQACGHLNSHKASLPITAVDMQWTEQTTQQNVLGGSLNSRSRNHADIWFIAFLLLPVKRLRFRHSFALLALPQQTLQHWVIRCIVVVQRLTHTQCDISSNESWQTRRQDTDRQVEKWSHSMSRKMFTTASRDKGTQWHIKKVNLYSAF